MQRSCTWVRKYWGIPTGFNMLSSCGPIGIAFPTLRNFVMYSPTGFVIGKEIFLWICRLSYQSKRRRFSIVRKVHSGRYLTLRQGHAKIGGSISHHSLWHGQYSEVFSKKKCRSCLLISGKLLLRDQWSPSSRCVLFLTPCICVFFCFITLLFTLIFFYFFHGNGGKWLFSTFLCITCSTSANCVLWYSSLERVQFQWPAVRYTACIVCCILMTDMHSLAQLRQIDDALRVLTVIFHVRKCVRDFGNLFIKTR